MVSTLTSPRVSASSPKSGEMSVVVTVWECCHMPFQHYNWRCSNILHMYVIDVQTFFQLSQIWGNVCGWNDKISPSITIEGAPTSYICMSWTWNTVWKVLQSQSYHSGVVSALTSPRVSASSPKSGETSVLVMVWVCSHTPIHHNWRCSNTLYAYDVDVECSLKGSTVSTIS